MYGGHNEVDLSADPARPVILCGGTNGAGKTTLFESIMLCLYGQQSFDRKITQKQYHDVILRSIHRRLGTSESASAASISVEFRFSHDGKVHEYRITREWENIDGRIDERLLVSKRHGGGGKYEKLDSIDEPGWQLFIDRLLPKGIARLFFFNGEQIQDIASAGNEQGHIRSSFDSLLGLDLVGQLQNDLGLYLLRNSDGNSKAILKELEQYNEEKEMREAKIVRIEEKQADLNARITSVQNTIGAMEEKFSKLGGDFARRREELTAEKSRLESRLEEAGREIRKMCSDTLPFFLIPKQTGELKEIMAQDRQKIQDGFRREILEEDHARLLSGLESGRIICEMSSGTKKEFLDNMKRLLSEPVEQMPKSTETAYDFSPSEMDRITGMIDSINASSGDEIRELAESYNATLMELGNVQKSLEMSPKDDEIGPLFSDMSRTSKSLGEMESELDHLKDIEAQERSMITLLNSKIRQNIVKRGAGNRRASGTDMIPDMQDALEEYSALLRTEKIGILEKYVLDGLRMLLHKSDLVEKISIDHDTFEVKLYKNNNDEITREMLSMGELQMYATAIIWGLAKTSGRPLPFVIDTPLARLDEEHRRNVVENFFPHASHQVVILSTNSEINPKYHSMLEPYISKSCIMEFDSGEGRTLIHDGYFQSEGKEIEV